MQYENPEIPENINTSKEHPLKDFSTLLIGSVVLVFAISIVLGLGGSWLAGKIPFSIENKIAGMYNITQHTNNEDSPALAEYLQQLVDKISVAQNLPKEMKISVHYMNDYTVNAFATLGGNLFIYRGLLEKIDNENTLVTLLAHEVAHVKYRHPIKSIGRGIAVGIAMSAITGSADSTILGEAGMLTVLSFSREMETQADEEAMATIQSIYGHLNGGAGLFEIFKKMRIDSDAKETTKIFSTHPLDQDRINNFSNIAEKMGWKEIGKITPLPNLFTDALD